MDIDFLTILFVILNLPALIAMMVLLSRNSELKIYQRIGWGALSIIFPISGLVLFTIKIPDYKQG